MPQQRTGRIVRTRATQSSNFRVKLPLHTGGSTATTQRPDTGVILPFLMPFVQRLCNVRRAVDTAQKTVVKSQSYPSLTHRRIKHRDTAKAYNKYMLVPSALLYGSTCKMVPTMLPGKASFKKRGKVTKAKPNCVATTRDRSAPSLRPPKLRCRNRFSRQLFDAIDLQLFAAFLEHVGDLPAQQLTQGELYLRAG